MSDCGCHAEAKNEAERRILRLALGLNATMFVVGAIAGLIAQSMGLIADSLDMLADACAYGIALAAWARTASFKASAAQLSGTLLLILGFGVLFGVAWRLLMGSHPEGIWNAYRQGFRTVGTPDLRCGSKRQVELLAFDRVLSSSCAHLPCSD